MICFLLGGQADAPKKKRPTRKEIARKYFANSIVAIHPGIWAGELLSIVISIRGPLSALPSVKNAIRQFPDPSVYGRIDALGWRYSEAVERAGFPKGLSFGSRRVFMLVSCAKRSRRFDPISVAETVQDWLEPASKIVGRTKKHARGWGAGLVDDDSQVVSISAHAEDLGLEPESTQVILLDWSIVAQGFEGVGRRVAEMSGLAATIERSKQILIGG